MGAGPVDCIALRTACVRINRIENIIGYPAGNFFVRDRRQEAVALQASAERGAVGTVKVKVPDNFTQLQFRVIVVYEQIGSGYVSFQYGCAAGKQNSRFAFSLA